MGVSVDAFDKAAWDVDKEFFNEEATCENVIEWVKNSKTVTVFFSQKRYITKIKRLAEKHPDKVQIVTENKDGSIVAHLPINAVHLSIVKRKEFTEEQRLAAIERMKIARAKRYGNRELTSEEIAEIEDEVDSGEFEDDEE